MDGDPFVDPDALPRIISRAAARRRGMSDDAIDQRTARGSWLRVLPRTYSTTGTVTNRDKLDAAVLYAGEDAALSGAAALFAHGVKRVAMPERVLVLVPYDNPTCSIDWCRVRRTERPFEAPPWWRPRRVEHARAVADLALTLRRLDDVRDLVARVVQARHCTVAELGAELASGPRRGSKNLRLALEEVGWGAASAPEALAARILRSAGVSGFIANATLRLPDGSTRIIDFYWPHLRACLEIDSVEWHWEQQAWTGTWDRHLSLSMFGYSVIHRPPSALRDVARFVADVLAWLAGREADLRRGLGIS